MSVETPPPVVVLFVDDEKHVVESLKDAMRKLPMTVLTATSGAAALRILEATPVDVVVSDELMPDMAGTELLAVLRVKHPQVLRIILTGHASAEAAIRAINEGEVYRFLSKPCKAADLAETILEGVRVHPPRPAGDRLERKFRTAAPVFEDLRRSSPEPPPAPPSGASCESDPDLNIAELIHEIESNRGS